MSLSKIIREEIGAEGVISFARFMEFALYCPVYGFYEAEKDSVGRDGDFYTSVSVGGLFGELLAFRFGCWLDEMQSLEAPFQIVEAGAHDGRLACDILEWFRDHRPKLLEQIRYEVIEPSVRRQGWQREALSAFTNVRWCSSFEELKAKSQNEKVTGVIFSNELLDAMPVHRFGWSTAAKSWFEWGVRSEGESFVWTRIPRQQFELPAALLQLPSSLLEVLPEDYTIDFSPAAEDWWRDAALTMGRGKLATFDYGFTTQEQFSPVRTNGTVRSFRRHRPTENILANPGEQDITAHVNFPTIRSIGESAGLKTEALVSQSNFLTRIVEQMTKTGQLPDWTPSRNRQFQTLTHPEHLGGRFHALIQSR